MSRLGTVVSAAGHGLGVFGSMRATVVAVDGGSLPAGTGTSS